MTTWKEAQQRVLGRLAEARRLVDEQDESTILALVNQQDAFCDKAKQVRDEAPTAGSSESRCHFCEGYIHGGGCLDRLDAIDRAVMSGDWDKAGELLDEYSLWVNSLPMA